MIAPRFLDHALFPEEIGTFQCAFLVGGFEDQAIAKVESENACLLATERRDAMLSPEDFRAQELMRIGIMT